DPPPGGGDTDIVTDDQGFAYFVDLEGLVNLGVAVSNDGGNTWKKNPLAVNPAQDRQWFAVDNGATSGAGDNTIFLTVHELADGTALQPTRRADQSGRVRGGSLRERCGRPCGERLRGLGRHGRPQRVRERILRRRPHLDRAVAGERGPREHERLAVDRRRRRG